MEINLTDKTLYFLLTRIKKIIDRRQEQRDKKWQKKFDSNFTKTDFFDHRLTDNTLIRLYKDSVLSKYIYFGFENDELEFMQKFLRPGDTFFDIGANIGLFSILASKKVGSGGYVFSFEPSPKTFSRLKANIELNKLTNVSPFNLGLSDANGHLKLNISESGYDAWNSFASAKNELLQSYVEVEVVPLDALLADKKVTRIDLIKLDVEGWEKFVLKGAEQFLTQNSPTLLVEFTETNAFAAGYLVQEIYDILKSWGYQWYRYKDGTLVPEEKQLRYPYDNLVATKDVQKTQGRLSG